MSTFVPRIERKLKALFGRDWKTINATYSASGEGGGVTSVNGDTGVVVLDQDDIGDGSTHVQTANDFTDALKTKLDGIEANADVTDTANVTSAGALMDSELTDLAGVKALDTSTLQAEPAEGAFVDGDKTKLDGIATGADVTGDNPPQAHTVASHSDTTATGAELNELTDGSETTLHSHAGGISEYMYPVWAEENNSLSANAYEWAFGNGANSPNDGGMTMYVPSGWTCEVVAMSLRIGSGTATVQLVHNGTPKGNDCNVAVSSGQSATNEISPAIAISNNDYINFRTQAASGTSSPNVVTAWIKMTETP